MRDMIHVTAEDVACYLMSIEDEAHQMSPPDAERLREWARVVVGSVKWAHPESRNPG